MSYPVEGRFDVFERGDSGMPRSRVVVEYQVWFRRRAEIKLSRCITTTGISCRIRRALSPGIRRSTPRRNGLRVVDALEIPPEGWTCMASSSKKKTTMAKLNREAAVRERRHRKKLKKDARKQAAVLGLTDPTSDTTTDDDLADGEITDGEPSDVQLETTSPTASPAG
jgi:hypothetical protein